MNALKRILPSPVVARLAAIRHRVQLRREFNEDMRRFGRHALLEDHLVGAGITGRQLEAQLTKDYHRVEKGLALRAPRRPFGDAVGARLDLLLPSASSNRAYAAYAESARQALTTWNGNGSVTEEVSPVRSLVDRGVGDADSFFGTRHSVRDFDHRDVTDKVLNHALELAINTPSVCNRQAWHVRFFRGPDSERARHFQNGNAGFGHLPVAALVTVDARMFAGRGERNQPWIEGGLFAMSFVWALHALGVDSCMLNMSQPNVVIDELRAEFGIPDCELVVMMIAIGYGRPGHRRARSPRRAIEDVRRV